MEPLTVGVIGLGLLGGALAERFLEQQQRVVGFDINHDRSESLRPLGLVTAASATDVVRQTALTFFSLPTSETVARVLEQLESDLRPAMYLVDTTTGAPEQMAEFGRRLHEQGVHYLDATIAGSSAQARQGEVVVFAGGEPADFEVCLPILEKFAKRSFHVGSWGSGAQVKLVHNLVLGLHRAVLAEGLGFARALGLDLSAVLELLRASPAYSAVMDTKGAKMVARDFSPQATIAQHHKDVRLILATAEQLGIRLPLSTLHDHLLDRVEAAGGAGQDNSAILRAFLDG